MRSRSAAAELILAQRLPGSPSHAAFAWIVVVERWEIASESALGDRRSFVTASLPLGLDAKARPSPTVTTSAVPGLRSRLILTASFDFGLPREQVVAIVFRKVALISDV